jgi:GT2 family glycosyltransferase
VTGPLTRSTIVVVTWRGRGHVGACLDAVAAQTRPHRLLVIDNASDDGTAEILARHPARPAVLRLPANVGYAGALAAAEVDTELTAWLNDDAEPAPDWLAHLEDALDRHREAAAAASRMVGLDGAVISLGVGLTASGHGVDLTAVDAPVFGFCGGAALLRTSVLREVGGVPARFFCYYEDTDTAWRLRLAGHTIVPVPDAVVTHRHGASSRPGSRQFHLWNERNRLAMLIRCAPATVAARELARFAALTALLPLRRALSRLRPEPAPTLAPVDNPPLTAPELSVPSGSVETGGPPRASERDIRSDSAGDNHASGGSQPQKRRWPSVAWKPGAPRTRERDSRSDSVGDNHASGGSQPRKRRWPSVAWKPGGPRTRERDIRSGSVGDDLVGGGSQPGNRRWPSVASKPGGPSQARERDIRSGSVGERAVPWNFRLGLRLRVLGEIAITLLPLLSERRTVSGVANVPRSVVWRRARSANSPS